MTGVIFQPATFRQETAKRIAGGKWRGQTQTCLVIAGTIKQCCLLQDPYITRYHSQYKIKFCSVFIHVIHFLFSQNLLDTAML